jgi:hypothetical protein
MIPALKFLDLIMDNASNVFNEYIVKEENRKKCMMPIAYYANDDKNSKNSDSDSDSDSSDDLIDFDKSGSKTEFGNFDKLISAVKPIEKSVRKKQTKKQSNDKKDHKKNSKKTSKKSSGSSNDNKKTEKTYCSLGDLFS